MKILKHILLVSLLCMQYLVGAQSDQGGFLEPVDTTKFPSTNVIYLPQEGLVFYSKPNGEYAGRISQSLPPYIQIPPGQPKSLYATIQWRSIRPTLLDLSYFFKTYDERFHIQFDKLESGYIRIVNTKNEAWVSVEDIKKWGFKITTWMDFYGAPDRSITIPAGKKLPLRLSPYNDAEIIANVDDEHFTIKIIPFDNTVKSCCEGLFCYVEVIQYKENPCKKGDYSEKNVIKTYKAWLKIIDESGDKIVMHNSGGC